MGFIVNHLRKHTEEKAFLFPSVGVDMLYKLSQVCIVYFTTHTTIWFLSSVLSYMFKKKHSCTLFSHYLYLYSLVHYTFSSMKIILCMNWRRKGLAIGVYDVTFNQIISTYVICCSYCDITYNVIVAILFYNKSYNSI